MKTDQAVRIRELFKSLGGRKMRMLDFAKIVWGAGIFTDDDLETFALKRMADECRRALAEIDPETGVPFAQPDEEDDWTQLILFSAEEMEALILRRVKNARDNVARVLRLIDYFKARFGYAPQVELDFGA